MLCTFVAGIGYWTLNQNNNQQYSNWQITGGSKENIKYSSLNEIDTNNVNSLKVAWVYHSEKDDSTKKGTMECNPIFANGILYGVSCKQYVVIACGGSKWGGNKSDSYVAFALPGH